MKTSTCERTDSTPSADEFYLLSMLLLSQHMLGVNKIPYETTICDKWEQHMHWGPLNQPPYAPISQKLPSPFRTLAEVGNWARHRNLPILALPAALCSVSTHNTRPPRWQRKFLLALSKLYRYSARTVNPVSFISTEFSLSEKRSTRERELRTHEQCFSDAQHKNLIKIVPEWWCEKHPAKSVINIKFISYISTIYHLSSCSTLRIVGTRMNPQIRTDLSWNLTFLLASHSFKLHP